MYFTAMTFDPLSPMTHYFLGNPEHAHAEILSLFEPGSSRPLFRVDNKKNEKIVYMVSENMPNVERWNNRFGIKPGQSLCQSADYEAFLASIKKGDLMSFKITAVPTKTTNGKKVSLDYKSALNWMSRKLIKGGAIPVEDSLMQAEEQSVKFRKGFASTTHEVYYRTRTYEGIFEVENVDKVVDMLRHGIGRQKAYGCGMLTVVPMSR